MLNVREEVLLDFKSEIDDLQKGERITEDDSYCYMVDQLDIHYREKDCDDWSLTIYDVKNIMNILDTKNKDLIECYFDVIEYLEKEEQNMKKGENIMTREEKERYVIVGCKVAELKRDNEITFTADKTFEQITELADELWKEFEKDDDRDCFSEFVPWALREREDRLNNVKRKYYVEIYSKKEEGYKPLIQSVWFDTKEESYNFITNFDFVDCDLCFSLMSSIWENDTYTDIIFVEDMKNKIANRSVAVNKGE